MRLNATTTKEKMHIKVSKCLRLCFIEPYLCNQLFRNLHLCKLVLAILSASILEQTQAICIRNYLTYN